MNITLFTLLVVFHLTLAQFFASNDLEHDDVKQTAAQEELLPAHLKNPFYQNPRIRAALAKNSWFGPGEKPVKARDTHRIPRKEIFLVLNHAGLLPQQQL